MRRSDLEHILRAASAVVDRRAFLVIGSQSVLGTWNELELPLLATMSSEADLAPISTIDRSRLAESIRIELQRWYPEDVDAGVDPQAISDRLELIGEWSAYHEEFDVYVQGVGTETAVLPSGWESRLVVLSSSATGYAAGLCLDPLDACAAKLVAGRDHDYTFVSALIDNGNIEPRALRERTLELPPGHPRTTHAQRWAEAAAASRSHPDE